ncbi:MAG: hypothetical protein MRZ79_10390 [Bacteroidia bacterium]|nr:hypothetical protein [Bacteroidia bacterium]
MTYLLKEYQEHCMSNRQVPGLDAMLRFMMEKEVIDPNKIRNLAINGDFIKHRHIDKESGKSSIVRKLAEEYQMHESSIWLILRRSKGN